MEFLGVTGIGIIGRSGLRGNFMAAKKKKKKSTRKKKSTKKAIRRTTKATKNIPPNVDIIEQPKLPRPTEGFLIGNGESRIGFNLNELKGKNGPIVGCNALYRDFEPDVLCALDQNVITEIQNSGYKGIVAKFNKSHTSVICDNVLLENLVVPRGKGVAWYTGIFAAWFMCTMAPKMKWKINRVFMLGFDLYDAKTNNIYKGTLNYEKMGINNKIQFQNFKNLVFDKFPDITFLRVVENPDKSPLPDEWIFIDNIRNISYTDFKEYL